MRKTQIIFAMIVTFIPALASAQVAEPVVRFLPPTNPWVKPVEFQSETSTTLPSPLSESNAPTQFHPEQIPPGVTLPSKEPSLDLCDLEAMALGNNPTLAQASAQVRAARATYVQVGLYPNPTVGYQGVEIGNEGKAGQQGIYLGQEFVLGRKLQLERNAASQAVRQAEQEFAAQRLRVLTDVRTGYYDALIAQKRMEIAGQLLHVGQQGFGTNEHLLKAGQISRAELLQSRIEFSSARILAANAQNDYQASWRKLSAVLGLPGIAPTWLKGDPETSLPNLQWEESLQNILVQSPELRAARAGVDRAQWVLRRSEVEPIPNIDVQFTMQHDNATTSDIVGIQAVLPVPLFNRNQGNIGRAQAEIMVARGEVQRIQLNLQQQLAATYVRYANAKQQVETYSREILPDAKTSLDLIDLAYRQGGFDYLRLLTAQRTYFHTNLAYLDALSELRESSVAIEGLLLTNSLSASPPPVDNNVGPVNDRYAPIIPGMGR